MPKDCLIEAVLEVKSKKMTVTEASTKFGIPRKMITNHVLGKIVDFRSTGRERALSDEEEASVVRYLKYMSRHNFPLRRSEVRGLIVVSNNSVIVVFSVLQLPLYFEKGVYLLNN